VDQNLNRDSNAQQQHRRHVLLLEYYGPAFSGAQRQDNAFTVQQAVEEALDALKIAHGPVVLAGRTDAGVHAKGQVFHVDIPENGLRPTHDLRKCLNAVFPKTLSVRDWVVSEDPTFHATTKAQWRWYQYRIYNQPVRSTWMGEDAYWHKYPLDVDAMHQAAQSLLGHQAFTSFKCPRSSVPEDRCNVIISEVTAEGPYVVYNIVANRFIYKMVRNIMGTLIQVGQENGAFSPEHMPEILAQADRRYAGPTAQPAGLSLMAVKYPAPWDFFHSDVYVTRLTQGIQESSFNVQNVLRKAS